MWVIIGRTRIANTIVKVVNPGLGAYSVVWTLCPYMVISVIIVSWCWVLIKLGFIPTYSRNLSAIVGPHSLLVIIVTRPWSLLIWEL